MERRAFVAAAGAALAAPGALLAQARTYRLGFVAAGGAATIADTSPYGGPLIKGLAKRGYVQGRNLSLERRAAEGKVDQLPRLLKELEDAKVDAIVTIGYVPALTAKQAGTVPVVAFAAGDPVGTGLVTSLARPGGNLTGISDASAELTPKRMELLRHAAPGLQRVAILWNTNDLSMTLRYEASEVGARAMGIAVQPLPLRSPADFDHAFAAMKRDRPQAILLVADGMTIVNRKRVIDFAAEQRLPVMYEFDFIVRDGGLMSYAPDLEESFDRVAYLVDRIFKGAKPAELPFEQPRRFRLAINIRTAKALGIVLPPAIVASADDVIE